MAGDRVEAFEALSRYALAKYKDKFEAAAPDCPYETRMGGYRALRQELAWFVYEWKNPSTGRTILEEFVRERMPRGGEMASRMLLRKDITHDTFEVVREAAADGGSSNSGSSNNDDEARATIRVRALGSKKEYEMAAPGSTGGFAEGSRFVGRIHPRGDGTYIACGTLTRPGEWDESRHAKSLARALSAGEISEYALEVTEEVIEDLSSTRAGPGRRLDTLELARAVQKTSYADGPLGFDGVDSREFDPDFDEERRKDTEAFEAAMSTEIQLDFKLRQILEVYPTRVLEMMCRELWIKSLPYRGMMIERLAAEVPDMVCENVTSSSKSEQNALAHVLHCEFLPYPDCDRELSMRANEGLDNFRYEEGDARWFLEPYMHYGLIMLGTTTTNGRRQKVVTVASDIRERILACPGWREYVESDGRKYTIKSTMLEY